MASSLPLTVRVRLFASLTLAVLGSPAGIESARAGASGPGQPRRASLSEQRSLTRGPEVQGFVGIVFTHNAIDLAPKLQGTLASVKVELGQRVEIGQVVASLDAQAIVQQITVAEAALHAAHAEQRASLAKLEEAAERRTRRERSPEAFSPEEIQTAVLAEKVAVADVEVAQARVAQDRARLSVLQTQLEDSTIKAPFAGNIAVRYRDLGSIVGPGMPIVRLISSDQPWVRFAVPGAHVDKLQKGRRVIVRGRDSDAQSMGVIRNIAPEIDSASCMLVAEAELDVANPHLDPVLPGMVVSVWVADAAPAEKSRYPQ